MIGIAASAADLAVAGEFFELFKTPWEPVRPGRRYRVVLSTLARSEDFDTDVLLLYGSSVHPIDRAAGVEVEPLSGPIDAGSPQGSLPLYGGVATFGSGPAGGGLAARGRSLEYARRLDRRLVRRIGYDLFGEVRYLLTTGQPATRAAIPTLELHIATLRRLLIESKIPFVEIPPRPAGYEFVCCLTHDVDFYGIRRHVFDRTILGVLARGSVGSLIDAARGRRPLADALRNWLAVAALPLVWLRVLRDFWRPFEDYAAIEARRRSTFFVIPFRGRPGVGPDGSVHAARAAPYGIGEIRADVRNAADRGSELGIHGIDAWRDAEAGRAEKRELEAATGRPARGIRMHWLYFDAGSPRRLEAAGFGYDSTWGYNEAIGYRAGTAQAFRPEACDTLLELPLSIMDSALFFPSRMNLSPAEALARCDEIVANARRFGGTLVINWHERSLAPERLWGRFYRTLLERVGAGDRAWFTTAAEAVAWFRWRRSITFVADLASADATVHVSARTSMLPGAIVRVHRPGPQGPEVEDLAYDPDTTAHVELASRRRAERPVGPHAASAPGAV
jgi:peptidoglycan/xylan/chitin deacetylase (PgdA/CDA1 family)